jgi:hypothetical protein
MDLIRFTEYTVIIFLNRINQLISIFFGGGDKYLNIIKIKVMLKGLSQNWKT